MTLTYNPVCPRIYQRCSINVWWHSWTQQSFQLHFRAECTFCYPDGPGYFRVTPYLCSSFPVNKVMSQWHHSESQASHGELTLRCHCQLKLKPHMWHHTVSWLWHYIVISLWTHCELSDSTVTSHGEFTPWGFWDVTVMSHERIAIINYTYNNLFIQVFKMCIMSFPWLISIQNSTELMPASNSKYLKSYYLKINMAAIAQIRSFRHQNITKYTWPPFLTGATSQWSHKDLTGVRSQLPDNCLTDMWLGLWGHRDITVISHEWYHSCEVTVR